MGLCSESDVPELLARELGPKTGTGTSSPSWNVIGVAVMNSGIIKLLPSGYCENVVKSGSMMVGAFIEFSLVDGISTNIEDESWDGGPALSEARRI